MLPNLEQQKSLELDAEDDSRAGFASYDDSAFNISISNQFYEKSSRILRHDWCEIVRRYLYQYT